MRVLTVRQPMAWAIMHGKSPENRGVVWSYTGPIAIHAGAKVDPAYMEHPAIAELLEELGFDPDPWAVFGAPEGRGIRLELSAVLGVVQMIGAHQAEDDCCPENPWADHTAHAHLALRNPRPFVDPIHDVTGSLGLWKPDDELLHLIGDRLVATVVDRSQR